MGKLLLLTLNEQEETAIDKIISAISNYMRLEPMQLTPVSVLSFPGLEIRQSQRRVFQDGEEVNLTRLEYNALVFLASNPGIAKADPDALPESEKNILTLAGARLLFATAEPHIYEAVTAVFSCAGTDFTARGKTVLAEGWKELQRRYRATLKDKPERTSNPALTAAPAKSKRKASPIPSANITGLTRRTILSAMSPGGAAGGSCPS